MLSVPRKIIRLGLQVNEPVDYSHTSLLTVPIFQSKEGCFHINPNSSPLGVSGNER